MFLLNKSNKNFLHFFRPQTFQYFNSNQNINYYDVLQLKKDATLREIQINYRKLAKIYHPDVYKGSDTKRFTLLQEAYETLKNSTKRREYDQKNNLQEKLKKDVSGEESKQNQGMYNFNQDSPLNEVNLEEEYNNFMKAPKTADLGNIEIVQDTFRRQLSQEEYNRREFLEKKNKPHLWALKYGHKLGYDQVLDDNVDFINEKAKQTDEVIKKKKDQEEKTFSNFYLAIQIFVIFAGIVIGGTWMQKRKQINEKLQRMAKKIEQENKKIEEIGIRDRMVFEQGKLIASSCTCKFKRCQQNFCVHRSNSIRLQLVFF